MDLFDKLFNFISSKSSLNYETREYLYKKYPRLFNDGIKRNQYKNYLVIIHTTQTACPKCKKFAKQIYIDDVFASGTKNYKYPLLSSAINNGVLLDSCHTTILTYYEGISTPPKK